MLSSTSSGVLYNQNDLFCFLGKRKLSFAYPEPEPEPKKVRFDFENTSNTGFLFYKKEKIVLSIENILFLRENPNINNLKEIIQWWVGREITENKCLNLRITAISNPFGAKKYHILNDPNAVEICNYKVLETLMEKKFYDLINVYRAYCELCPNSLTYGSFFKKIIFLRNMKNINANKDLVKKQ